MILSSEQIDIKIKNLTEAKWFSTIMLLCCLGYALFKAAYREVGDIFQTILFIGTLFALYAERKKIIQDRVFILLILSIFIPIFSWINALIHAPQLASETPQIGAIVNFYFFFFIAYWLKGSSTYCKWFLTTFVFGVFLTLLFHSPDFLQEISLAFKGHRVDFHYINANHGAALLGGVVIIGFIYMVEYFQKLKAERKGVNPFIASLCVLISGSMLLVFTQSRQAWFAAFIAILLMSIVILLVRKTLSIKHVTLFAFAVSIVTVVMLFQIPIVYQRLTSELYIIPNVLSGDVDNIPYSSMGARLHFWYESIIWIKENPLFGLGDNARSFVISMSTRLPEYIRVQFSHLHNGYLEVLVNYGILGLLNFFLLFSLLIKSTFTKSTTVYITAFSVGFISYFLIINCFESFLSFKSGMYLFNCMTAVIYTFHLKRTLEN